ncbi:MAG: hypothetical protein KAW56_12630 [Candidatus Marinimicrobia bacterium]|nr:hypothetical protein [Candidatus Neomarinimicrobiota bacterium]
MKSIVKSIRFPEPILDEVQSVMDKKNFNFTEFVIEAIKNYIRILKYTDVINSSYGIWSNSNHPELKNGVNGYIRILREGRNI